MLVMVNVDGGQWCWWWSVVLMWSMTMVVSGVAVSGVGGGDQ